MRIHATKKRSARTLLRAMASVSAMAALLGAGLLTPRATAQQDATTPKTDTPAPTTTPRTDATTNDKPNAPLVLGNDEINPNQPIKPTFIINVAVVGEADPSGAYRVDESGNVGIRYQGIQTPVSVKSMTPTQAAGAIAKFLKTYIKNPQVTVSIVSIPREQVFVGGAVRRPGPVIITPEITLVDLLSRVEWSDNADLSQVRISRHVKDGNDEKRVQMILHVDRYIKVESGAVPDETQNPVLQDKDNIFVPYKSLIGNGVIAVGGEVAHPLPDIPIRSNPPITVREAISLAGGTTEFADRKAISIRRASVDRPLVIDLDKAEQGDIVNNIELRPDDAVYVERLQSNAYIQVNGGFVRPGKFIYDKRTTLEQLIQEAGGIAPYAKEQSGYIMRHPDGDPKHSKVIAFNWDAIKKGKSADIELQPGDSVTIEPGGPGHPVTILQVFGVLSNALSLYNNVTGRYYGIL